jgi:mRNA-degrading endonuclease YafQ of YafQ-DinJ toxin-antitoxin module
MYNLVFTETYNKKAKKFFKHHPELKNAYFKVIEILEADPFHPQLKTKKLAGKKSKFHKVYVKYSCRLIIEIVISENEIIPIEIGMREGIYS